MWEYNEQSDNIIVETVDLQLETFHLQEKIVVLIINTCDDMHNNFMVCYLKHR